MRLSIIGLPGSGKTHLAQAIGIKLKVPHIHLDRFWFEAGGLFKYTHGSEEEKEQVRAYVREQALRAIAEEAWVSDGFYSHLQPEIAERVDAIIFLDISLRQRLLNHAIRMFNFEARHKELRFWHDVRFFSEIIKSTFERGPKLKDFVSQYKHKVVILESRAEIEKYLRNLS